MTNEIQTCEQYEDRLAALHRASLELVQDNSVETLLERIAVIAREQANARYAAVGMLGENGELERFIPIGITPELVQKMKDPPSGKGLIGVLMRGQETIRIADIQDDPRSSGFPRYHPHMTSFLGVPIRIGNRNLGQIYLTDKQSASEFSFEDQQIIETLAGYAAVAISNARLYARLKQRDQVLTRRNENLLLLNDLATNLASFTDMDEILNTVLTQVMEHLDLDVGEIFLLQETSKMLKLVQHRSLTVKRLWKQKQFQVGEGTVGMTAKSLHPTQIELYRSNDQNLDPAILDGHFRLLACFPLKGHSGALGVLCVATRQTKAFDDLDLQFLTIISSWVGTVIENSRLNIQQRRLAVLEERERIGMDLHDGVIQSIYAVGLTLEHAQLLLNEDTTKATERIAQAINDLNSTIRDIRSYILDLRPRQLHGENLMQGIQRLVSEFRVHTLVDVNLQGSKTELDDLPEAHAIALFHICQEALANIAKHARARHVDVAVWTAADRALLEERDDGRGFDLGRTRQSLGHGLSNMQTRARNAGGDVDITSEPGQGTTLLAWVPLNQEGPSPASKNDDEDDQKFDYVPSVS
jgi:two-component system, NarL family, sensor histidine kinase DevS